MVKKIFWVLSILVLMVVIFLFGFTIYSSDLNTLNRYNTYIQMAYTILTAILVSFTYLALKGTQIQKHQAVRPYLVVITDGIWGHQNNNDLDISIYNEGAGLALNIELSIKRKIDNRTFFERKYTRLAVKESPIYYVLGDISNSLRRNDNITTVCGSNCIEEEIDIHDAVENYGEIEITVIYQDIYGKRYKGVFDCKYDCQENEYNECIETISEM